jgi:hypothetical protein
MVARSIISSIYRAVMRNEHRPAVSATKIRLLVGTAQAP